MHEEHDPEAANGDPQDDPIDIFWDIICSSFPIFQFLIVINVVILILLVLSLLYTEPGTAASILAQISIVMVLLMLLASVKVVRECKKRS